MPLGQTPMPKRQPAKKSTDFHRVMNARHVIRATDGVNHLVVDFDGKVPISACGERVQRGGREGFNCADCQALRYLRNGEHACEKCARFVETNPTPL